MFDVSFTELMIIGVVALIVIGPERLPKVARTVGHLLGRAQRYVNDVKSDIRREIELDELRKFKEQMQEAADSMQSSLRETGASLRAPLDELSRSFSETAAEVRGAVSGPDKNNDKDKAEPAQADLDFPALTTPPGTPGSPDTAPAPAPQGGVSTEPAPEPAPEPARTESAETEPAAADPAATAPARAEPPPADPTDTRKPS
ncbi:Sec-independent protein translocase protein TatB [Orrella sp. JC864]|uniref:Sec-independent protein translocase protein TatB n=1 Tax=Orrella sp. JC864 TaxID=3120298 RepID=UPI003009710A